LAWTLPTPNAAKAATANSMLFISAPLCEFSSEETD
jgi:hypothetical protein